MINGNEDFSHREASSILFVTPSAYILGGVQDWLDYLLRGLEDLGWDCTLGLVEGDHHDVDAYLAKHPWQKVVRIKNPTGSMEGRVRALISAIEKTRMDVVAVVNVVDAYEALRRMRRAGKATPKLTATLHGLQSDLLADLRAEADVIDAVIATNRLSAKLVTQAIQSVDRVLYAPYGVPLFDDVETCAPQRNEELRLLYSGRLEQEQKRILDLPYLLSALRGRGVKAQLSLAGGGPDEAALRKQFESLGLLSQVSFLGVLNQQDLSQQYRKHDALIITSVWETGPIVAWEAMSHGLPVVSSRYVGSGLEGSLVDGVNSLLFPVGDMQAAAAAAARLAEPGMRASLVRGGFDLLKRRYSREASIAQWHAALGRVMALPLLDRPGPGRSSLPSGRLDAWLGAEWGERFRRALGKTYKHLDAGGEWPHSAHGCRDETTFLAQAAVLDAARPDATGRVTRE